MKSTDDVEFASIVAKTWRFYGKEITAEVCQDWFELLADFEISDIKAAFRKHLADSEHGRFLPKPADIIRFLPVRSLDDDNRPGTDEAWGMLLRLIQDERETGMLTDEMRAGWQACQPILDMGDEVGARRCFIEVYAREVGIARRHHAPVRWEVSLGTDSRLREIRLHEAIHAGRISHDHAQSLLPGPAPVSIDHVAGLLEGPGATKADFDVAARLRGLAQALRQGLNDSRDREREERERQRAEEAEKKLDIQRLLDERGYGASGSEEAA